MLIIFSDVTVLSEVTVCFVLDFLTLLLFGHGCPAFDVLSWLCSAVLSFFKTKRQKN
jgi:hypothetical protein